MDALDLELSILDNEDNIIDYLCECAMDDSVMVLSESIGFLIESTEYNEAYKYTAEYNNLKKQFNNCDDEETANGIIGKIKSNFKALLKWWYKEEPDKKFKMLRLIITLALSITVLIIGIKAPGTKALSKKLLNSKVVGSAINNIGYTGKTKALKKVFSPKHLSFAFTRSAYFMIIDLIRSLSNATHDKINKKDLENNIKACDTTIDKLNDILSKMDEDDPNRAEVEREIADVEDVLKALMKVRQRTTRPDVDTTDEFKREVM